ncbi:tRNA:m(4)X modification enzyme TRM13 homolog isoform X2 [Watersipora subatra]|uniref:tRNA:m(4)X modification enzyme TRM13 homolog isoform X2 n=1 Tax=Watersipora subatra TaxID=2589382 RepID=UPI00355BFBE6
MCDKTEPKGCIISPGPGCCNFYLPHKRRHCKFPPPAGEKFCVQHLPTDNSGQSELKGMKRVVCPLDPNHSVYEYKLSSHLKKCNSKKSPNRPFYKDGVNSGSSKDGEPVSVSLSEVDVDFLKQLVDKIRQVYQKYIRLEERLEEHEALKEELVNELHQKCLKHRKQEASLLGNMERAGWLTDGTTFIEFGAGRARLTSYLLGTISNQRNSSVLLIDRGTTRNKSENKHKYVEGGPSFERLRIDIKDLMLEEHHVLKGVDRDIVAYSKHLCGSATDLTLRCLERVMRATSTEKAESKKPRLNQPHKYIFSVKGIQIALCCHHKCTWTAYAGKEFWLEQQLTPDDFIITKTLSSWATCAFPDRNAEEHTAHADSDTLNRFSFWTSEERENIGLMSKRIIDIGREHHLKTLGYKTNLVIYVKKETSLENIMLVARPID